MSRKNPRIRILFFFQRLYFFIRPSYRPKPVQLVSYANFTAGNVLPFGKHVRRSAAVVYTNAGFPKPPRALRVGYSRDPDCERNSVTFEKNFSPITGDGNVLFCFFFLVLVQEQEHRCDMALTLYVHADLHCQEAEP